MEKSMMVSSKEEKENVNNQIIQVFEELDLAIEDVSFTVGEYRKC